MMVIAKSDAICFANFNMLVAMLSAGMAALKILVFNNVILSTDDTKYAVHLDIYYNVFWFSFPNTRRDKAFQQNT